MLCRKISIFFYNFLKVRLVDILFFLTFPVFIKNVKLGRIFHEHTSNSRSKSWDCFSIFKLPILRPHQLKF